MNVVTFNLLLIYILVNSVKNFTFHCYQIVIKLDRCVRSCNTHIDLSNKVCVPNKTRFKYKWVQHDARINESKILIKHVSCICKCKFDGRKRNGNQCRNVDVRVRNVIHVKKIILGISLHVYAEIVNI